MKGLFGSLIATALAIPLFVLFIRVYNAVLAKKSRKERLYFCQKRLHNMALCFRDECITATQKVIAQFAAVMGGKSYLRAPNYMTFSFLNDYNKLIRSMREDYLVNYATKYSEGDTSLRCEAEDLPRYLLDEYEAEISEIATTFRALSDCMLQQIEEVIAN